MDNIVTPIYEDDNEEGVLYNRIQKPIHQWAADQYVGSTRARELGLWKSDDDPDRTWTVEGTVTLYEDNIDNLTLIAEADTFHLAIDSYRDMWGTYYFVSVGKGEIEYKIAQEDGTRSMLRALRDALDVMIDETEYSMKEAEKKF